MRTITKIIYLLWQQWRPSADKSDTFRLLFRQPGRIFRIATLISSLWVLLTPSASFGQALQWSQFISPQGVPANSKNNATYAVERAADGSIYALVSTIQGSNNLQFRTSDVVVYGQKASPAFYTYLAKYSADGTTLLWVRLITTSGPTSNVTPLDLALTAAGEPVILLYAFGPLDGIITPDAWQPNAPSFTGDPNGFNSTMALAKFSASGALTYGTYIGPTGGALQMPSNTPSNANTPQLLSVGADGKVYLSFMTNQLSGQTGQVPTTANAYKTSRQSGSTFDSHLMIFNANNTLNYSSYLGWAQVHQQKIAPNGDLYVSYLAFSGTQLPGFSAPPANGGFSGAIIRYNSSGQVVKAIYVPKSVLAGAGPYDHIFSFDFRPNGNLVGMTVYGDVIEYDASLSTIVERYNPLGMNISGSLNSVTDVALDAAGRLHFTAWVNPANTPKPTTPGALQTADATLPATLKSYYGIVDCTAKKIVYGTELTAGTGTSNFLDIDISGCTAYLAGQNRQAGFPVTASAYSGTTTVTGYDITPLSTAGNTSDAVLMAFNIPTFKTGTNVLTTPAITTFCAGSGVLPIDGSAAAYLTPTVIGRADASPAPVPIHYQWQVATSSAGPWTDIPDSDIEDYSPTPPAVAGQYCYRRLVRQTPFGEGFCVPSCDVTQTSNVICLTFSNNKTHTTNIPKGKYGLCKGSAALALSFTVSPSADGTKGPYTYKMTTLTNLTTTVLNQSGTVASAPGTINLSVGTPGDYLLQVTDSRGCVSFDTLTVENLALDAGPSTKFTCGAPTVKIGPISLPSEYINFATNTFSWSPAAGLDNPAAVSPTFTHGLAVGDSTMKYLTFNGCKVDSVKIVNQAVSLLPTLPDLAVCQGDTVRLGTNGTGTKLLTAQSGVTYEWAPGIGLTSNSQITPLVTTLSAPQGVNVVTYTLLATAGNTGCVQTTTQKLTTYRTPNQSFNLKACMKNGGDKTKTLQFSSFGTPSEPGISYSWQAVVVDDPANTSNTGLPTNAQALTFLSSTTASLVSLDSKTPGLGYATKYGYTIYYIRTSFNTANPACARVDTAEMYYCTGRGGPFCAAALGNLPSIACGGPDNKIGPLTASSYGKYYWSRLDGQPLNNELFDPITKVALTNGGPHPANIIANPAGLVAVSYRLTFVLDGAVDSNDTCRIDIKVFPGAVAKPNVNYPSPQAVCQGVPYTIQGPAGQPAYTYLWTPTASFQTAADTAKALPTLKGLTGTASVYVTVTDPSTGCFVKDTVSLVVTPVDVNAGSDATFCVGGATVNIGGAKAIQGYTYQWTAVPATGVTFGSATSAQTTATLPATTAGNKITLYLTATNGLTAANCTLKDSVVYTAAAAPTITIPTPDRLCAGGEVTIGPITPSDASNTYAWTGPGIVSGGSTPTVKVNAVGTYTVTVSQGTCSANKTITVSAVTLPTVTPNPAAPCASDATIGVTNVAAAGTGWTYSWDKLDGMSAYAADFSTITVRPTAATTYTLTAEHSSGCVKTFTITVPGAAYVAILPSTLNICEGQSATLPLNSPSAVSGTVVWTASSSAALSALSSTTSVNPTVNVTNLTRGSYTYTATVTYGAGCTATADIVVNVGKKIENIAGLDAEICQGSCTTIGTTAINGMSYQWSSSPIDASQSGFTNAQITVCPTQTTTYTLKYTDVSGCTFTDEVLVKATVANPTLSVIDLNACQNAAGNAVVNLASAITANTGTITTYWLNASATVTSASSVSMPGTYYIKSATANGTCSTIAKVNVIINDLPTGVLVPSINCATNLGTLTLSNYTSSIRYDVVAGPTYTGNKSYATAAVVPGSGIVTSTAVADQAYTVRIFTAEGCFIDLSSTASSALCPKGSLGDYVWKDTNRNGRQDAGEVGVNGVKVILWSATTTGTPVAKLDSATTSGVGANAGKYLFSNLPKGDYVVQFVKSTIPAECSGFTAKDTTAVGTTDKTDSDADKVTGITGKVSLDPKVLSATSTAADSLATNNLTVDAGLVAPLGSIGDFVWKDANRNGRQDAGEVGVNGVKVILWSSTTTGSPVAKLDSATTAGAGVNAGKYLFSNLPKGDYVVQFVKSTIPAECSGFTAKDTTAVGTTDKTDSDADKVTGITAKVSLDPKVLSGTSTPADSLATNNLTVDAGLVAAVGSIGDLIWKDANDNGLQDLPTEKGVAGVKVNLYAASGGTKTGSILQTKTTAADGLYLFTGLLAGDYIVEIDKTSLKDTCAITTKQNTGGDDTKDSDFNPTTGLSQVVTLNPVFNPTTPTEILATNNLTVDAGLVKVCIVPTRSVAATDPTCLVAGKIELTATNGDKYGLSKGATYTGPAYASATSVGTLPVLIKGNISHAADSTWTIRVFNKDNTCFKDTTVTVKALVKDATVSVVNGFPACRSNGTAYSIKFTKSPAGSVVTAKNVATGAAIVVTGDSVANVPLTVAKVRLIVTNGVCKDSVEVTAPVCNKPVGSIGDLIWKDVNDNGLQDLPTEKGVAGVKVNLYAASGGTKTGSILQTKTTAADGLYLFTGLLAGDYIVEIDKTSLKDTCAITTKQNTGGDDTKDSDFNPTTGLSQVVTLNPVFNPTTPTEILATNNLTVDAGLVKVCIVPTRSVAATDPTCLVAGKIELTATNGDKYGVSKGATYTGAAYASATSVGTLPVLIKGNISHAADSTWTIRVFNKDNTCFKDTTVTVKALVKDATVSVNNGFPACRVNGTAYTIKFTKSPAGSVVTAKNVATGVAIPVTGDSVANVPLTVAKVRLIVTNGVCKDSVEVTAPVCNKPVGSIGDLIWKDVNDNGLQDLPTEKGVAGVKVNLYAASGGTKTGSILQTKTTAADGLYLFTGLLAGSYIVEIDKTSLKDTCAITTKQNTGGDDTKDSDFNPTTGLSQVVTLNPVFNPTTPTEILATNNLTVDAGLVKMCIVPTRSVAATDPTCAVAGKIELTATNGDKYGVSKGTTYTGPAYASATSVGILPVLIKGNISHAADSTWTIRVFNKDNICFKDTTVTVKALVKDATVSVVNGFPACRSNGTAYSIKFTKSPAGAVVTAKNVATGAAIAVTGDSVANISISVAKVRLIVTNGVCKDSVEVTAPVCNKPVGSIGDLIWKDVNDNGLQDLPTEKGVAGVKVNLYAASGGTKTGSILQTKTTGTDGLYLFTGLLAGDYIVEIDKTTLPSTCEISSKQNVPNDDTKDSDFNPTSGLSQVVTLNPVFNPTTPTELLATNNFTVDAGLVVPCVKSKVTLTGAPVCSADVQTYSITFSVTNKVGTLKVNKGTLTGANPYTVTSIPSGATIKITDSLSAVCKFDTLITGPNCNCNPPLPILIAGSVTACAGDTFPTLKATVVGLATVEWFTQATGGTSVFTGLNYKPAGTVPTTGAVFYAQARSTDPTCPTAISTSRVMATINAQDCTKEVDLALKKSINTKIAQIGDVLTYTLKVWNESNVNATGVEVVDSIATTVQFQAGSFVASRGSASIAGNVIKWNIGNIAANGVPANGDTVTLIYKVKATQEGVHFNTAEISKTNEKDKDSTPSNGKDNEDDIDHQCFTVPIKLCTGSKVEASVPTKYTNVQWFKDGGSVPIASGNVVLLSGVGIYTYTASNQTCPAGGCCPIIIENSTNCCPVEKCVPLTITKIKK